MQQKGLPCTADSRVYVPRVSHSSLPSLFFFGTPKIKPHWASKAHVRGACLPSAGPPSWEPDVGLRPLTPVGEPLQYHYCPVQGSPTQEYGT